MRARQLVMMLIYSSKDHAIRGRTLLQKMMYFLSLELQECLNNKPQLKYKPHYYGPFSYEVDQALNELIGIEAVEQSCYRYGNNNRGIEVQRYEYKTTKLGEELAIHLKENAYPDVYCKVEEFVKTIENINNLDYYNLSLAAKLYYILEKENARMTKEKVKEIANELNWKLTDYDIRVAVDVLSKLNLPPAS